MLSLEGEWSDVLPAVLGGVDNVLTLHPSGGFNGAQSMAMHAALERYLLDGPSQAPSNGYAVSVGGCNALAHACRAVRQLGHGYHTDFCTPEFVRPGQLAWFTGTKINLDFYRKKLLQLFADRQPYHPENRVRFGVTHYETAQAHTLEASLTDWPRVIELATASAYLPCVRDKYVVIDGVPYTDGGISDPLPIKRALEPTTRYVLALMPHTPEYNARWDRLTERLLFSTPGRRLPAVLRRHVLARDELFRTQLQEIRVQLKLSVGDPARWLPPTCLVWPAGKLPLIEQNKERIKAVAEAVRQDMHELIARVRVH
ncbi:MAG: patatin-like phospholipase family protein [Patescibacteria group bacterium]